MSKYHIRDAQHDTSNLAATKAELTWMQLEFFSLLLPLDLVTNARLRKIAMHFFVGAFCRVAWRGIDIYQKTLKKNLLLSLARFFASPSRDSYRF